MPATRQDVPVEEIPFEVGATARHRLGMPPARFLRDYWQKRPLLIRSAFPDFTPPLSPDDLAGLACMDGALARIVSHDAKHDRWTLRTGPLDDATFAKLPETNWTLLVQDVDKWDADTAALLEHFKFIPSWRIDDVMVSYAVDGGGVGAHVDQYDVFLLQGLGQRRWSIDTRPNPSTAFRDDVELKLLREFHPTHTWMLDPGDMLYLPPGVPHDGVAVGECMTFSIGMRAPAAGELLFDFAGHVAEALPESLRFTDPDLKPAGDAGEIDAAALHRARRAVGPASAALDDDAFADWFGGFITRYRAAQVPAPRKRGVDRASLAERLPRVVLERDPWTRFAWRRRKRDARLYAAGAAFDAPLGWARELASGARVSDGARLARLPQQARGMALLAALIDAGHLHLRKR
ncbi:MAG TPA: cupin domain-containing protein [Rhodanobacteraceae bacterium]|jgi:50S ribosomal protein L16 3-hydroxylase